LNASGLLHKQGILAQSLNIVNQPFLIRFSQNPISNL